MSLLVAWGFDFTIQKPPAGKARPPLAVAAAARFAPAKICAGFAASASPPRPAKLDHLLQLRLLPALNLRLRLLAVAAAPRLPLLPRLLRLLRLRLLLLLSLRLRWSALCFQNPCLRLRLRLRQRL